MLAMIAEDDSLSSEEKKLASIFINEIIYDKHFTIKELLQIIKDPKKARELAKDIMSRKNYIGRFSLERYLSYIGYLEKKEK